MGVANIIYSLKVFVTAELIKMNFEKELVRHYNPGEYAADSSSSDDSDAYEIPAEGCTNSQQSDGQLNAALSSNSSVLPSADGPQTTTVPESTGKNLQLNAT